MSTNPFALSNIEQGGSAAAPATDNPFSLRVIQRDQKQDLRVGLQQAVRTNPDHAAEVDRLAQRYPAPKDVLLRNLQDVQLQAAVDAADEKLGGSPKLADYMRTSPWVAKQSHDDLDALTQVAQFFSDTGGSVKAGVFGAAKGASGLGRATAEFVAPPLDILEGVTAIGGNPLRRLAEGFAMLAEQNAASAKDSAPKTTGILDSGFQSGIQSLTQNLLTLPMAFMGPGGQSAALAGMTGFTGGNAYEDAREKGLPMSQAIPFAASQAAIEYATEKLPLGALLKDVKAGAPFLETLARQVAMEVPGEQVATILQDLNEWAVLNPDKPFTSYLDERPSAAAQTLVATIVGAGGNVAVVKGIEKALTLGTGNAAKIADAERVNAGLQAAMQAAAASKLRERNPETFKQLVQYLADNNEGQTPTSVFIDAQVLAQSGVNVAEVFPGVAEQMDAALATNGSVEVPISEVLTAAPGTPLEQVFLQNARATPDGISMAEAEQAFKQADQWKAEADRVMAEAQDQAAWQQSADNVKSNLLGQLNTAGRFTADVNEAYATLVRDFYATMAGRQGITPEEMYQRYPLRIAAQGMGGQQLDQITPEQAMQTNVPVEMPVAPEFGEAVGNTPGAQVTENGLLIDLVRFQKPEQEGAQAIRTGVFYLPTGAATAKHYRNKGTMASGNAYGGSEEFKGQTLIRRPLFVKGATGGKAPEVAYDTLKGKGAYQKMRTDVLNATTGWGANPAQKVENVSEMLARYGADPALASEIVRVSNKGNLLPYAVQENIVAHAVREAGHDAVVGYSKGKAGASISEVFDVREQTFPARGMDSEVHDAFNQSAPFNGTEQATTPIGDATEIEVDGKMRPALNSNGQPIHWSVEGVRNFWRWFGDSRVVDADGKPLVVYHGTRTGGFDTFKPNIRKGEQLGFGTHFAVDEAFADKYANDQTVARKGKTPQVYSVYLKSDAPLIADAVVVEGTAEFALAKKLAGSKLFTMKDENGKLTAYMQNAIDATGPQRAEKLIQEAGFDGIRYVSRVGTQGVGARVTGKSTSWITFNPTQIKSATGNSGAFDGQDANILRQNARGTFSPDQMLLTLNANADLSTFLHESAHFFLEVMADLASQPNAPTDVADDMNRLLKWFGVADTATWNAMTLDQKRPHHERFAESFEQYLLEGKAPSAELQPLFRKFRAWMVNVYKSLTQFMRGRNLKLSDEVRQVFDRMLAAEEAIAQQEEVSGLLPDFDATNEAIEKLQARSLRDLKWTVNARSRALKELTAEAESLRREARMDARREVMTHPVYRAYRFLTAKMPKADREAVKPVAAPKSADGPVDESIDSMFVAIAKLGGLDRAEVESQWGFDKKERGPSPLFGKPLLRRTGGLSLDAMGERLAEYGYLAKDENGKYDMADFEAAFDSEYRGGAVYAYGFDYARTQGEQRAGEGASEDTLGAGRFDLTALKAIDVPEDVIAKLTERGMTAKDGIHPDILADMFGFDGGQEFAKVMATAFPMGQEIEGTTDRLMLERHGDLATPEAIEEAANDAVHNEARAKSLATELKAQADMLNTREQTGTASNGRAITVNALTKAAKEFAQNLAARRRVKDLKRAAQQHRAAEAKAGKRWQEATAKADTQAAVAAKRDQVLNNATVKALNEAQAEAKKIVEFFRKVTKDGNEKLVDKGRDPDVVNAMRAILAAYDVAPRLEKGALEYMEAVAKNDPAMYAALQPSVQGAMNNAKPMAEMTMEEMRGLHDEMRAMWHLAKRSRQMEVDGNLLDIEDAADELVNRMRDVGIPLTIPGERGAITTSEEAGIKLQFAKAILSRVEQWAERLDGKFGGPFLRLVFQPVKDAADRYRTDRVAYRKKFTALLDGIAPTLKPGPIDAPELGYKFGNARDSGTAELLHAILHTGNESNKRKLLLGRNWATENADGTLDTSRWDVFIQRMVEAGVIQKAHYDFAQGVWDLLEETKPLAQKTHREVFGRYFAEVTADAFDTPFGSYRGGYVPAQTDSRLVKDAKLRELAEGENESMAYAFPASPSGFTKSRVEYNKPLLLDLRALAQHMDKVLLFSHMQGAVTDVRRLLTDKRVSYALDRLQPGAYEGMLIPWLNRAAKQVVETPTIGDRKLSRFLSAMRSRAGMALMFANLSNTVQQVTGFSLAAVKVKPSLMMSATGQFVANPKQTREAVAGASAYMRNRMLNEVGAMNDAVEQILVNPGMYERAQAWTQRHAYFLQAAVDNTMSPIIWTAAYNQGIEQKMTHGEAVRFADGVIRQTQGSTLPEDISRFESGPAAARLFTQFVSYFNMMANTNATAVKQIADEMGLRKGAGKLVYVALAGLLAPIWVAEAIAQAFKGGPEDEDDDGYLDDWLAAVFGLGTIKGLVATVPIVGQAAQLVVNQFNTNPADDKFSLSPAVSLLESAVRAPKSVYEAIVDDGKVQKAVRDVAAAATMATGLPFFAAARPLGYAAGVATGEIDPTSEVDAVRGVLTGNASPDSKN